MKDRAIAFENRTLTAKARRRKGNAKENRRLDDRGRFDDEFAFLCVIFAALRLALDFQVKGDRPTHERTARTQQEQVQAVAVDARTTSAGSR